MASESCESVAKDSGDVILTGEISRVGESTASQSGKRGQKRNLKPELAEKGNCSTEQDRWKTRRFRNTAEAVTPHGSYKSYYHRRVDDRVPLLQVEWVRGRRVLDVGCNDGGVSLQIARELEPACVIGVDIDTALIARAKQRLRTINRSQKRRRSVRQAEGSTTSTYRENDACAVEQHCRDTAESSVDSNREKRDKFASCSKVSNSFSREHLSFPHNVSFYKMDFASGECDAGLEEESFDLVLMLSVTKWVHLHGGDSALKLLFRNARNSLRTGGLLILEPQLSISYKRARYNMRKTCTDNLEKSYVPQNTLHLKPEQFTDYLLSVEGGFSKMECLRSVRDKGQPFNRPVYALWK